MIHCQLIEKKNEHNLCEFEQNIRENIPKEEIFAQFCCRSIVLQCL